MSSFFVCVRYHTNPCPKVPNLNQKTLPIGAGSDLHRSSEHLRYHGLDRFASGLPGTGAGVRMYLFLRQQTTGGNATIAKDSRNLMKVEAVILWLWLIIC